MVATQQQPITYTALYTPFTDKGTIDIDALSAQVNRQYQAGIRGQVLFGSTGEGGDICQGEYRDTIRQIRQIHPHITLIAGVCGLSTSKFRGMARWAEEAGANQVMIGMPPYIRAPQRVLQKHIAEVARSTRLPAIIYNVPSRTGTDLLPQTVAGIRDQVPNVYAIKEATPSGTSRIDGYHAQGLQFFIGNDDQMQPGGVLGADGLISVVSNIIPREVAHIVASAAREPLQASRDYRRIESLVSAMNSMDDPNPIPVKFAASELGWCQATYRTLCPPTIPMQARVRAALAELNLVRQEDLALTG